MPTINVAAHERAASDLKQVKPMIDDLVATLRTAQSNVSGNTVMVGNEDVLAPASGQLSSIIKSCLEVAGQIDTVAANIVAAARQVYNEELAAEEAARRAAEEEMAARKRAAKKSSVQGTSGGTNVAAVSRSGRSVNMTK